MPFHFTHQSSAHPNFPRYGEVEYHDEDWSRISPQAKELVQKMMDRNPEQRLSIEEVLKSAWVIKPPMKVVRFLRFLNHHHCHHHHHHHCHYCHHCHHYHYHHYHHHHFSFCVI